MTKLDELNVFLSERLSAAVNEILETVSRMMQEYEEETSRIRKENDYLKEMVKLTGWSFTELIPGADLEKQDDLSNLQQESGTFEGWCKEESTSIKIEQPDPAYPAFPDSENTDTHPIPDPDMSSPVSDVWITMKNHKGKAKLKLKKKHYCLYCKKPSLRMAQHLLSAHAKEPEVAKALSYDKKSKERKQLLDLLQSKGNLLHKDVGMSRTKQRTTTGSNKDYVQCMYCLRSYIRKNIANHIKKCKHKFPCTADASTANPTPSNVTSPTGISLRKELPTTNQKPSPEPIKSSPKMEILNPQSISTPISETTHSTAQLFTDTEPSCEDSGWVVEQLLADLEPQNDLTPESSLIKNNNGHKKTNCSSPACNQNETINSEDEKTDAEQSSQNGHMPENIRNSYPVETQSRRIMIPSDEEESGVQNMHLHICQHCKATFCSPYHLRRHEYTHTGERPYWCSECNMGFIQKYRYRNHRMTYHGERPGSVYKDQPRTRKNQPFSGENPEESELHQQELPEGTAGTPEHSNHSEETV